ncbi:MAG: septal ring lytic transglycosylase RlpA family protein [Pseudomonadota bacterium]
MKIGFAMTRSETLLEQPIKRAALAAARACALIFLGITLAACGSSVERAEINNKTKFKSEDYGVKASKRVTVSKTVAKGGGTYKIGSPYQVKGRWFYPKEETDYDKTGLASWYGPNFHGRLTANGEIYDQYHLSAAHPTFPLPSYARVTNLDNGHSVVVRVNDRGPFKKGRIIDVSSRTADLLEMKHHGLASVRVQYIGKARMDGQDMRYLMASFEKDGQRAPAPAGEDDSGSGIMLAMNGPRRAIASVFGMRPAVAASSKTNEQTVIAVKGPRLTAALDIALPEIGPIPQTRPSEMPALASTENVTLASYAHKRVHQKANTPFTAVLNDENRLTGAAIAAAWKRRQN